MAKRRALDDVTVGGCLTCGGRGGYPGARGVEALTLCGRCSGTGMDPARGEAWFVPALLVQALPEEG